MLFCLSIIYVYIHTTVVELSSCDRMYGLQSWSYLLSGLLQKKFAHPNFRI